MKKILFLCLLCLMCLYSCTNDDAEIDPTLLLPENNSGQKENTFSVHLDDIQMYMSKSSLKARSGGNGDIQTITYGKDTVMYLINYDNGWEVLPGDKRYPLQVAFNEAGNLDFKDMNPAQKMWFDSMAEEIHFMKTYGDTLQNVNCKVWASLNKKNNVIKARNEGGEGGNWIHHNTRITTDIYQKEHLITTHWGQLYPYNDYCPLTSTGYDHCPAGCAAIAGAQVLNYLHKLWGTPSKTVANATYNTTTNTYSFSDWTTPWSEITFGNTETIARFIGHLGVLCNTIYDDNFGTSNVEEKLAPALQAYGIGCTTTTYWNSSIIKTNLDSNLPIIVGMLGKNGTENLAHALIIDGYKSIRYNYTDVYIYISDMASYQGDIYDHDESGDPVPAEGSTQEESYYTTEIYYQFNWGSTTFYDDTYYLSTSSVKHPSKPAYYTIKEQMLYNLHIK